MERNEIRNALGDRLDVEDLKYDIKRLSAEMNYNKSRTVIFEQTIKAQQSDLDEILGTSQHPKFQKEIYK